MDNKRRRSIRTLETDLPRHITSKASDAFDEYIQKRKQRRLGHEQIPEISEEHNRSAQAPIHLPDQDSGRVDRAGTPPQHQYPIIADARLPDASDDIQQDDNEDNYDNDDPQQSSLLLPEQPAEHTDEPDVPDEWLRTESQEHVITGQHTQSTEPHNFTKLLKKGLRYAASWANVLAFLSITGRTRHSREQYFILESAVRTSSDQADDMLSYSSVRENQTKYFDKNCFPTSKIIWTPCENLKQKPNKLINKVKTADGEVKDARECIKVVLPSAWARYDLSLHPMYTDLIEGDHHTDKTKISIEHTPLVTNRDHAIGDSSSFWAQYKDTIVNVDIGTQLKIELSTPLPEDDSLSLWPREHDDGKYFLTCTTGPQWCVTKEGCQSRRTPHLDTTQLTAEEHDIYNHFKESELCIEGFIIAEEAEKNAKKRGPSTNSKKQSVIKPKISPTSIFPTDVCVFLRPPDNVTRQNRHRRMVCLLVSSFLAKITGQPSERII